MVSNLCHRLLELFHKIDETMWKAMGIGQRFNRHRELTGIGRIAHLIMPHQSLTVTAWNIFEALVADQRNLHAFQCHDRIEEPRC